jgi:hypothetical protein
VKTRILGGLLVSLLCLGGVHAQVISHLTGISPLLTLPTVDAQVLHLPGFDANLGTLTGVKFTFTGYASQTARGERYENAPAIDPDNYSYQVVSQLSLGRTGGPNLFSFAPVMISGSGVLGDFDGATDFIGVSAFDSGEVVTSLNGVFQVSNAQLDSYISASELDFNVLLTGVAPMLIPGLAFGESTNMAGGTLLVEYSYSLIPEPTTYALTVGLVVLAVVARRRRVFPTTA